MFEALMKNKSFILVAAASVLFAILELFLLRLDLFFQTLLFLLTLAVPSLLLFFYGEYSLERRRSEIDYFLPSALFQLSSFPPSTPMEKLFECVARGNFGALSEEFDLALRQLNAGHSVKKTLEGIKARNSSLLLSRSCDLLLEHYRSGAKGSSEMFRDVAEDVYSLQEIVRETSSSLSLQKYTLLAGGSVLVPLLLALLFNISSSLEQGFSRDLLGFAPNPGLQETILLSTELYLGIFALVSGVFIARMEEKPAKALLYFVFMCLVSLALFNIVRGAIII